MFNALNFINSHVITSINCMLSVGSQRYIMIGVAQGYNIIVEILIPSWR